MNTSLIESTTASVTWTASESVHISSFELSLNSTGSIGTVLKSRLRSMYIYIDIYKHEYNIIYNMLHMDFKRKKCKYENHVKAKIAKVAIFILLTNPILFSFHCAVC